MKILIITPYWLPVTNGVARHCYELSKRLIAEGVTVRVLISPPDHCKITEFRPLENVKISRLSGFNGKIRFKIKEEKFDLIHAHCASKASAIAMGLSLMLKKPYIVTSHCADLFSMDISRAVAKIFLHEANELIAVSRYTAKKLSKFAEVSPAKIHIIPNGVDVHTFNPLADGNKIRRKYSLKNKKIILYAGRLAPEKGVYYLLKAFPIIARKVPQARLLIAGRGSLEKILHSFIKQRKLEQLITYVGYVSEHDLPNIYAAADVFVLPSIWEEGFGMTMLEAMATGKPVIATNVGGIPEIIDNQRTGILVEPRDPIRLASAIISIIKDEGFAKEIGKNARQIVEKKFEWRLIAKRTIELYETLISDENPEPINAKCKHNLFKRTLKPKGESLPYRFARKCYKLNVSRSKRMFILGGALIEAYL